MCSRSQSSDESFIGLIATEKRLLVLSKEIWEDNGQGQKQVEKPKEGVKKQEEGVELVEKLKEGVELVEILVRGCFLQNQVGAHADECDALRRCGSWTLTIFQRLLSIRALPPKVKDETMLEWISSMGRGVASVLEVMKDLPRPLPEEARERIAQLASIAQITSLADGWLNAADAEQRELAKRNKEAGHQAGRALQQAQKAYYELLGR